MKLAHRPVIRVLAALLLGSSAVVSGSFLIAQPPARGGLGIYLVLWSGEAKGRRMPKLPKGLKRPATAAELRSALESRIPEGDQYRLRVVVVDISVP